MKENRIGKYAQYDREEELYKRNNLTRRTPTPSLSSQVNQVLPMQTISADIETGVGSYSNKAYEEDTSKL